MARPKKNKSSQLVALLENYYTNIACGDIVKLKYSLLEEYFKKCGIEVEAYNLRRDKEFVEALERLKKDANPLERLKKDVAYKTLDVENLIKNCYDLKSLKSALEDLDGYWKSVYQKMAVVIEDNQKLKSENAKIIKELAKVEKELDSAKCEKAKVEKDYQILKKENVYCKGQIKKYIYPAVANRLMKELRLPAKESNEVSPVAFTDFIGDKRPSGFEGIQEMSERKTSREEELLKALREQVDS